MYALIALIICGSATGLIFDIFRAMRAAGKNGVLITVFGDVLFWIISMYMTARCLWIFNNGEIRLFEILGFVFGLFLYILLLEKVILKIFTFVFKNIFNFIDLIYQILLTPFKFLYKIIVVSLYTKLKEKQKSRKVKGHKKNECR